MLLHITSLPSRWGIGDLGPSAFQFVDFLKVAQHHLWQVLPINPVDEFNSPYQGLSAFAGNPLFISPDLLAEQGLLRPEDLKDGKPFPLRSVDFDEVKRWKHFVFERAFEHFEQDASSQDRTELEEFEAAGSDWLHDYALFAALLEAQDGRLWTAWPAPLAGRDPEVLKVAGEQLSYRVRYHRFVQYLFAQQWQRLHTYARVHGVRLIGDIPIYVAQQSADTWSHPDLFALDAGGNPTEVAGVPPDLFSATGQRWGNPVYRWDQLAADGYAWWIERARHTLRHVDQIRIDHFRGFVSYFAIPASSPTAEQGSWREGPGPALFHAIADALGHLPFLAEDLGIITPDVIALRDQFGFPGMRVIQFAFGGPDNDHLPHRHLANTVVYTGTHDNDTAAGWVQSLSPSEDAFARRYVGPAWDGDPIGAAIRLAYGSVANTAIIPLQDHLRLGSRARMNYPGRIIGWWRWRCTERDLRPEVAAALEELSVTYDRAGREDQTETAPVTES
ncbi:MAG: 4-alpha-glucanotransferase [Chloroflexi bacterium]|nr:4-alpha-glucanotransferase [Chloroflexota bacterium]